METFFFPYLCTAKNNLTHFMKRKFLLTITALVAAQVMAAATVSIPTAGGSYISWNDATLTGANVENNGANIGSTGKSTVATFTVQNDTQQNYVLTFATGSKYEATMQVTLTNTATSDVVLSKSVAIVNTGAWTPSYATNFFLSELPAATYELKFAVTQAASYAGNWGKLAFYTTESYDKAPGTIHIANGSYNGPKLENSNTNVGYVSDGGTASYSFVCSQAGVYKMTIPMTRYGEGSITATVTDEATGTLEADGTWTMTNPSNYADTDIPVEGELTTGLKTLTLQFATSASFLCNYKDITMTRVADHYAKVGGVAIAGQTVTAGTSSDWFCQLPVDYSAATTTFSVDAANGTLQVTAADENSQAVTVTDNGNGTYTIPTPQMNASTLVTVTLVPAEGAYYSRTTYTFQIFRLGEVRLSDITLDGISIADDVLSTLNASPYSATFTNVFTSMPAVVVTLVDGSTLTGTNPVVNGSAATYTLHAEIGSLSRDFTLTLEGLNIYEATADDETVQLKYTGDGVLDNVWSNGLYSLSPVGDGWNNSGFKLRANQTPFTLTMPSDVQVKQFIIHEFKDNYADGSFDAITSEGMTASIPFRHAFGHSDAGKYDLVINLSNHTAGTPIVFGFTGGSQVTGWYELTIVKAALTTAPVKTAQSVTVVNNHAVVAVTFDREIPADVTATINNTTVTAEGGSATLYFPIWDLDYSTDYTLTIAAGAVTDAYGNSNTSAIEVALSTSAKPVVAQTAYDYVVGTADEFRAAVSGVNSSNTSASAPRKTIFLKNGDYNLGSSSGTVIQITGYNVSLIGESRDGVIIRGTSSGISNPVLNLRDRTGFYLQDLTVRNDFDYGAPETGEFKGVSVAIYGGDKTVMKNVRMQANQDTQVTGNRAYFENCEIHGTVDFICGGGDNYYYQTDLVLMNRGGNCITAPSTNASQKWGYVFQECTIRPVNDAAAATNAQSYNLGRPWQSEPRAYYLNTTMQVLPANNGWAAMGTLPTHFYEYNSMDASGNAVDLSVRGNSSTSTNQYTPVLSAAEAARFTLKNVLGGTDSWLPTEECPVMAAPASLSVSGTVLSWEGVTDARCYVVLKDGQYFANVAGTSCDLGEATGLFTVRAANLNGGLGQTSQAVVKTSAIGWTTVCLSYDAAVPAGTKAYYISAASADEVTLTELTEVPAGEGFIFNAAEGSYAFEAAAVPLPALSNNLLVGTQVATTFAAESAYVLSQINDSTVGMALYTGTSMTAGKAYLPAASVPSDARQLKISFEDATTGISAVHVAVSVKACYNLSGQRVQGSPKPGLYILNGKKVMLK